MKIYSTLILLCISFNAFSAHNMFKMTSVNGACIGNNSLTGGECVNISAVINNALNLDKRLDLNIKRSDASYSDSIYKIAQKGEDPLCKKYKDRLKKYQAEGVMGINPATGKLQKMKGKQAQDVIKDTKENISILCN
ncbi:MAG: hypothetical protein KZQ93_20170 [Candidatus Thiodiazotropha sp. (ex Monitilora ramsayi)]|nr:hypothetical protein [Candidatus Thiodiazotropha sp. (ex Monitilora ramsayi)]